MNNDGGDALYEYRSGGYELTWQPEERSLRVELQAEASGWIAFAIAGKGGGMLGSEGINPAIVGTVRDMTCTGRRVHCPAVSHDATRWFACGHVPRHAPPARHPRCRWTRPPGSARSAGTS